MQVSIVNGMKNLVLFDSRQKSFLILGGHVRSFAERSRHYGVVLKYLSWKRQTSFPFDRCGNH